MVEQGVRRELPEARIKLPSFGYDFDRNIRKTGFNAVPDADHILSRNGRSIQELKGLVYEDLKRFAALPDDIKLRYNTDPTGQRGYNPDGVEQSGALRELREHIMMARPLPQGHPLEMFQPLFYGPNLPLADVSTLVPLVEELLDCLDELTLQTFEKVEQYLELSYGLLAGKLVRGQSFLRAHMYPSADEVVAHRVLDNVMAIGGVGVKGVEVVDVRYKGKLLENVVRASPHPDMGYFTWLLGSAVGGLNIQLSDGSAMPFRTDPGSIVGNTADFVGKDVPGYPSVIHWVGMSPETAMKVRLSLANFVHPRPTTYIGEELAGVLIFERLHEIGYTFGQARDNPTAVLNARDELIRRVRHCSQDTELVPKVLAWEQQALRDNVITKPELGRYFVLTNAKSGTYERLRAKTN